MTPDVSIIVPFSSAEENVVPLLKQVRRLRDGIGNTDKGIFVHDGSQDGTGQTNFYYHLEGDRELSGKYLTTQRDFGQQLWPRRPAAARFFASCFLRAKPALLSSFRSKPFAGE